MHDFELSVIFLRFGMVFGAMTPRGYVHKVVRAVVSESTNSTKAREAAITSAIEEARAGEEDLIPVSHIIIPT